MRWQYRQCFRYASFISLLMQVEIATFDSAPPGAPICPFSMTHTGREPQRRPGAACRAPPAPRPPAGETGPGTKAAQKTAGAVFRVPRVAAHTEGDQW